MTRLLLRFALLGALFMPIAGQAQRIAFVNTKYILEQMPEYQGAQEELDRLSAQWQQEVDERHDMIKRMRDAYNAEAILLTEEMKKSRQEEIEKREREARDLQKRRFGPQGDLFKKREELIQPIQDRIFDAIKEVAGTSYVAVFDIGGVGNNVLFASEKYDKSDSVLRKLGIKPDHDKSSGNTREGEGEDQPPQDEENATPEKTPENNAEPQRGGGGDIVKPR